MCKLVMRMFALLACCTDDGVQLPVVMAAWTWQLGFNKMLCFQPVAVKESQWNNPAFIHVCVLIMLTSGRHLLLTQGQTFN